MTALHGKILATPPSPAGAHAMTAAFSSEPLALFFAMVVAHALADYPLQGDFLSKAKNRVSPIPGVPWYQALGAHAAIHAGFVWALCGLWWLGVAEFAAHAVIDDAKCRGRLSFNQDQAAHIGCKVVWVLIAWGVRP